MRDFSVSNLFDRRVRMAWETDGGLDMRARATAKAKEILGDHKPEPLPEDVANELTAIVARCEKAGRGASPR